jgi:hypothetical protein
MRKRDSFVKPSKAMVTHSTIVKNGWGIEPHSVFAQQSLGSTLPINIKFLSIK